MLFELLAKSPTFLAATGLRLRRGLLCVDDVRLDFQTLDRGRCYSIGFRHPNFHPMAADSPGVWNIQSVDLASGVTTAAGFQASLVKQLTIVKTSFVWSVVKTSDVVVYGWKTLRSYRGEPLTMQRLPSPASPCPGSWPAASGSSTPHLITVLSSALAGQKSVQTSCMRRHSSIVSASSSTVAARHKRSSRRGIIAFLFPSGQSDFLELFPEFAPCFAMYKRFVNNVDFVINPAKIKNGREGVIAQTILARIKRTERIFCFSNKSQRDIVYDLVVCPEHVVLYLKALDIRMHALHSIGLNGPMYGARQGVGRTP